MSIGFGKKVFVKLHKDLREKIAEVVHFAEIPALAFVSARRNLCAKCTKGKSGHLTASPRSANLQPTHAPAIPKALCTIH
jgi:hypothetical protein